MTESTTRPRTFVLSFHDQQMEGDRWDYAVDQLNRFLKGNPEYDVDVASAQILGAQTYILAVFTRREVILPPAPEPSASVNPVKSDEDRVELVAVFGLFIVLLCVCVICYYFGGSHV